MLLCGSPNNEYFWKTCKWCKCPTVITFDYVTLLECSKCSHTKMRHTQCIMGQGRPYVNLAWRIRAVYFLFVPASKFHRPFSNLWVWIKILIIWAAVSSKDLKRATMLLVVYVISFLLFCHQTGQCIINGSLAWNYDINESFQLFELTNILTRIFYVIF